MPHLFDRDGAGRRIETPAAQYHVFKYEQPLLALGVVVPVRIEAGRRREGEPTCQFLVETRLIDACVAAHVVARPVRLRSEEHTSELQSLMRISSAVFCLEKKSIIVAKYTQHASMYD